MAASARLAAARGALQEGQRIFAAQLGARIGKRPIGPGGQVLAAQRNQLDVGKILRDVYCTQTGISANSQIPNDPELPLPLNQVHPIHEVVHVDYFLPGCPPSADAIWAFFNDLIAGLTPHLGHGLMHYD